MCGNPGFADVALIASLSLSFYISMSRLSVRVVVFYFTYYFLFAMISTVTCSGMNYNLLMF